MSIYTTQTLNIPTFSQWTLNGCVVQNGNLIISPSFVPSSPIAYATGYRGIGGYGKGYAAYTDPSDLLQTIETSADSPDVPITPVSMAALGQIIIAQSVPLGCIVRVMCSYDSGQSWHVAQNGSWFPGMVRNGAFTYSKVRFRLIFITQQQGITPSVSGLMAYIVGRTLSPASQQLPAFTVPCMTATLPDFVQRLQAALPARWFGDDHPNLDGLLNGAATAWLSVLQQICALHQQTRLQTASAPMLDMAAWDFYGANLLRNPGESDASFSFRLRARVFQPMVTRYAVQQAVEIVTGNEAEVLEIGRPADCGGYRLSAGYTAGGHYGSLTAQPYQAFITAYRPVPKSTTGMGGYRAGALGYSDSGAYADLNTRLSAVDSAIYSAVEKTRPAGSAMWVRILSAPLTYGPVVPL